jgi:hypothetical protein
MADNARSAIRAWVDEQGSQDNAATLLGYDQGTISRALDQSRQPTLGFLIRFCDKTKRSLDSVLGRAAPTLAERPMTDDEIDKIARYTAEHMVNRSQSEPPPPASQRRPSLLPPPLPQLPPAKKTPKRRHRPKKHG